MQSTARVQARGFKRDEVYIAYPDCDPRPCALHPALTSPWGWRRAAGQPLPRYTHARARLLAHRRPNRHTSRGRTSTSRRSGTGGGGRRKPRVRQGRAPSSSAALCRRAGTGRGIVEPAARGRKEQRREHQRQQQQRAGDKPVSTTVHAHARTPANVAAIQVLHRRGPEPRARPTSRAG